MNAIFHKFVDAISIEIMIEYVIIVPTCTLNYCPPPKKKENIPTEIFDSANNDNAQPTCHKKLHLKNVIESLRVISTQCTLVLINVYCVCALAIAQKIIKSKNLDHDKY